MYNEHITIENDYDFDELADLCWEEGIEEDGCFMDMLKEFAKEEEFMDFVKQQYPMNIIGTDTFITLVRSLEEQYKEAFEAWLNVNDV